MWAVVIVVRGNMAGVQGVKAQDEGQGEAAAAAAAVASSHSPVSGAASGTERRAHGEQNGRSHGAGGGNG
jgi:hypothetical protein